MLKFHKYRWWDAKCHITVIEISYLWFHWHILQYCGFKLGHVILRLNLYLFHSIRRKYTIYAKFHKYRKWNAKRHMISIEISYLWFHWHMLQYCDFKFGHVILRLNLYLFSLGWMQICDISRNGINTDR